MAESQEEIIREMWQKIALEASDSGLTVDEVANAVSILTGLSRIKARIALRESANDLIKPTKMASKALSKFLGEK